MRKIIVTLMIAAAATTAAAQERTSRLLLKARAAYSIGATAPLGIPASIRSIESFRLTPSFLAGIDANYAFSQHLGLQLGLLLEHKAMDGEVTTKDYGMRLVMDEDEMEGRYTGHVRQEVKMTMLTVPLQLSVDLSRRLQLRAGPYVSLLLARRFSGYAFSGYLRKDNPTGAKVVMGSEDNERATYDFGSDLRRLQTGVAVGADWLLARRLGLSASLEWGLNGIFRSDFKTVEQTLYPIYGSVGVFYSIN